MKTENNIDRYGRRHTYLRISLTDKCNLSCSYCTPVHGLKLSDKAEQLGTGEVVRAARIAAGLGIQKIRFTGGEPLFRNDIHSIIRQVKGIYGIERVSITTNGVVLRHMIAPLKDAGIDSLNISLDSLDPERFKTITGSRAFNDVMDGIFAAIAQGFSPKINVVALDSLGADEADRFLEFASMHPVTIRFIELMPLCGGGNPKAEFMPVQRIERYLVGKHGLANPRMDGVAKVYPLGGRGAIGFISPISHPFCDQCNRIRLSSTGTLYGCLFDSSGINIRHLLRNSTNNEEIMRIFHDVLLFKKPSHGLDESNLRDRVPEIKNLIRLIGG